jgi:hypothetical protein
MKQRSEPNKAKIKYTYKFVLFFNNFIISQQIIISGVYKEKHARLMLFVGITFL